MQIGNLHEFERSPLFMHGHIKSCHYSCMNIWKVAIIIYPKYIKSWHYFSCMNKYMKNCHAWMWKVATSHQPNCSIYIRCKVFKFQLHFFFGLSWKITNSTFILASLFCQYGGLLYFSTTDSLHDWIARTPTEPCQILLPRKNNNNRKRHGVWNCQIR